MQLDKRQPGDGKGSVEIDLSIPVDTLATGWTAALARLPKISVLSESFAAPSPPKAVSLTVGKQAIKTFGFTFPEAPNWNIGKREEKGTPEKSATPDPPPQDPNKPRTRSRGSSLLATS